MQQPSRSEGKRKPNLGSEGVLRRSSRIRANAGLPDASSSFKTNVLPNEVEMLHDTREPECYADAASDPRWPEAMKSEYSSLKTHGTFTHVKHYDRKPITCKWVFKIKINAGVRYGADGAPKNAGPQPFSPPRPTQRPGAGCLFRHSLPLSPLRPPPHSYPRRVPVKNKC